MDRSTPIILYAVTYSVDSLYQSVATYTARNVFARVQSTSRREWQAAHEQGLNPELEATMFGPDYEGEKAVGIDGKLYTVYRTYQGTNDELTLYLERQVGGEAITIDDDDDPAPTPDPDEGDDDGEESPD